MWSDRLSRPSREQLVEQLHTILPSPRIDARTLVSELPDKSDAVTMAGALWPRPGFVWLDRPDSAWIAADPIAQITTRSGRTVICGPGGRLEIEVRGLDVLEAALQAWGGAARGGAAAEGSGRNGAAVGEAASRGPAGATLCGYLGYELGAELENLALPEHQPEDLPDTQLGLYDWHYERTANGWKISGTDAWRSAPEPRFPYGRGPVTAAGMLPSEEAATEAGTFQKHDRQGAVVSSPDAAGFEAAVARTVERIHNGELFQVNLCRRLETSLAADAIWPLYLRLRSISPAAQGALIRTGSASAVLSVSPELFLDLRNGRVRSCPIKGTRPRGPSSEEDQRLAAELTASEKDRAELAMIVDVTRNDLGRVCRAGSVRVARHAELVSLPTVHHTFSEVTGELRGDSSAVDLLRASFPPASITGAPKIRAMELAALEEGRRRGPCMGSIGWISLDGDLELSVAIRTAVANEGRVWYLAGCGITAESDPPEELAESETKAVAFLRALTSLII